jgi:sulfate adenylyltransferase
MGYAEDRACYVRLDEADGEAVKSISSKELKRRLEWGLEIPEWFSFPGVVAELRRSFPPRSRQGFTVFFTGLSGSGKSTIAKALMVRLMEMRSRPVTLLDGDIVRKNLSSELTFSKEHRNLNITRASAMWPARSPKTAASPSVPPSPRMRSRATRTGGYIEVYVATPLDVCEQRDRKGLYAKARAGLVKGVTGVSDPYIPPSHPEIVIDTSTMTPAEAVQDILLYLEEQGYIR